jgi:hypothetical protein
VRSCPPAAAVFSAREAQGALPRTLRSPACRRVQAGLGVADRLAKEGGQVAALRLMPEQAWQVVPAADERQPRAGEDYGGKGRRGGRRLTGASQLGRCAANPRPGQAAGRGRLSPHQHGLRSRPIGRAGSSPHHQRRATLGERQSTWQGAHSRRSGRPPVWFATQSQPPRAGGSARRQLYVHRAC